jgi:hypothetical protein
MRSIVGHPGPATPANTPGDRAERLRAADPEQHRQALLFLSGYSPAIFDTILDAVEPPGQPAPGTEDPAPSCATCTAPIGIFPRLGPDWQHYRGPRTRRPVPDIRPRPHPRPHLAPGTRHTMTS